MTTAVVPGSFDPFTTGHLDLVRRASALVDRVIVAVSHNPNKNHLLDIETRLRTIRDTLEQEGLTTVTAEALPSGLLVDFAKGRGATHLIKGLRSQIDLAYEEPMARMNQHLEGIDTVFVLTDPSLSHISSTLVREVAGLGRDVSDFVPAPVLGALTATLAKDS
ncbi:pantetheine-phosphate adenylyltransferase [Helcobacillus massiliensis]|uniref:Phosphopantetheine adenylyltransferase n=1 Tax=Helcobacillus massiliensis TaxID=521392 RepID=A0A839QTK3_9MICO|nr:MULTISPECIES: pantetheine-phosphate adenylyltransferase [Helcobacillus]MBB3022179.1 pantetheine-phosphate adenylyltransferase [Helcobacillus massiliensis]MCG7426756.1 pantetheine-phosphate adenylyltransferase [Helcobacillus sp. ACRRO]MCT1557296.1 pantetheine-phosphate adenylyltransferase [Helcobacillus massiliensis]MCT2036225.1 pantetheine-phosphate adenylyltransferase [Helcobacillus massiliensis]MCT2331581.1 pantetheine-phosphate adenylyltransferase [Helcobacillus massiliensis]